MSPKLQYINHISLRCAVRNRDAQFIKTSPRAVTRPRSAMEISEKGLENGGFSIPTQKSILSNYNLMPSLSDALEFVGINIFGIGIHHTSLLGIWFAWTLSVLTLIFVKATRDLP